MSDKPEFRGGVSEGDKREFPESYEAPSNHKKGGHKSKHIVFTDENTEQLPYKYDKDDPRKLARVIAGIFEQAEKQNLAPGSTIKVKVDQAEFRDIDKNDVISVKNKVILDRIKIDKQVEFELTKEKDGLHLYGNSGKIHFAKTIDVPLLGEQTLDLKGEMLRFSKTNDGRVKVTLSNWILPGFRNNKDDEGKTHTKPYMCRDLGPIPASDSLPKISVIAPKEIIAKQEKKPSTLPDVIIATGDKNK